MRASTFILSLAAACALAVWLLLRLVVNADPAIPANVAVALGLIFVASGCVVSLISWGVTRRLVGEDRWALALRHGVWGGAFVVALPILRWLDALSPLVIGAVLLILCGLESLILLQPEAVEVDKAVEQ